MYRFFLMEGRCLIIINSTTIIWKKLDLENSGKKFGSGGNELHNQEEEELLDWDFYVKNLPPPKKSGVIRIRLKYIGRSKPITIGVKNNKTEKAKVT